MTRLPVIVGFGGVNAAGRSSFHHAYRRMILESLSPEQRQETIAGLAVMMGLVSYNNGVYSDDQGNKYSQAEVEAKLADEVTDGTLVRRIGKQYFDVDNVVDFTDVTVQNVQQSTFELARTKLPKDIPDNWTVEEVNARTVRVTVDGDAAMKLETSRVMDVQSAGQLPTGFQPGELYNSRFHPRGLQLTVVAAADAVNSVGIPWQTVMDSVAPDEISVYASSAMSQLDENGLGGVMQSRLRSGRVTSKQLPLGLNSMPADFVNAYVCGSMGTTGSMTGACASMLYNLRLGVEDIRSGRRRISIVGASEAPLTSEVIEGYDAMSALGKDEQLRKLDGSEQADHRRASRPFGNNCGFTLAESAQYFVLMDDELAVELGADIYGAVNDVFVSADGFKKSISSPGPGNYVTLAKAVASARAIIGEEAIRKHSFVQAHGSSTPQNRVTESIILDKIAAAFDIENWPVSAVKAYIGHPLGPASGDQLAATLGVFAHGYLPGIKTVDEIADDVIDERLNIVLEDIKLDDPQVAFLNTKGFGGNNATASILAPSVVRRMLEKRYGAEAMAEYDSRLQQTREKAREYDHAFSTGDYRTIYVFGDRLVDEADIVLEKDRVSIPGYQAVNLDLANPYSDMSD